MTRGPLTRARHLAEYLAVRALQLGLRPLPMRTVRRAGEALGAVAYRVSGSRRRIALENLTQAYPDSTADERERIVRGMFAHFGRLLLELLRFGTLSDREILALSETRGEEHVRRAYARGHGVLFFTGHFGYWEMSGIAHALCWTPMAVVARPLDNPRLHDMLEQIRTRTGNAVIYRQGSVRKILRHLSDNRGIAMLIDQHLHTADAVRVDFFGRPAATTSALAALALRTGAAVVPVATLPREGGRYTFEYGEAIDPPPADDPDAIYELTRRCTAALEERIRRHPDLWLWMHRRWRDDPAAASADPITGETVLQPAPDDERHV
jgi:KDO2-lipid IV(A) lauroyltransferase